MGDHVEREHQVPVVVGGPDVVLDLDPDHALVAVVGPRDHGVQRDARLPAGQRLLDALLDQAERVRVDRREDLLPHRTAEVRAHHPLARRRGEDHPDRRVDLLRTGDQRDAPAGGELYGKAPPRPDQIPARVHATITFVEPAVIQDVRASTRMLYVITGSPTRAIGLPLTSTVGEPVTTLPELVGGFWNEVPGGGMCGGAFCETLPCTAAPRPLTSTSVDTRQARFPAYGSGVGVGTGPPGDR